MHLLDYQPLNLSAPQNRLKNMPFLPEKRTEKQEKVPRKRIISVGLIIFSVEVFIKNRIIPVPHPPKTPFSTPTNIFLLKNPYKTSTYTL